MRLKRWPRLWRRPALDPLAHLEAHLLEVRDLAALSRALGWTAPPLLEGHPLDQFRYWEDLNDRPLRDAEVLGAACRNAAGATLLEIGTGEGVSTALMAVNAPQATVYTVNIPPEEAAGGGRLITAAPNRETIGRCYRERGLTNVRQIFADTRRWKPDLGPIDVAFIDGCHDEDFVYRDSLLVLAHLAPGGLILWHDFDPSRRRVFGWIDEVCRALDRLYHERRLTEPLLHVRDSWIGLYRAQKP